MEQEVCCFWVFGDLVLVEQRVWFGEVVRVVWLLGLVMLIIYFFKFLSGGNIGGRIYQGYLVCQGFQIEDYKKFGWFEEILFLSFLVFLVLLVI